MEHSVKNFIVGQVRKVEWSGNVVEWSRYYLKSSLGVFPTEENTRMRRKSERPTSASASLRVTGWFKDVTTGSSWIRESDEPRQRKK